jgi:hypothetical protein
MPAPHSREVNFTEADHGCSHGKVSTLNFTEDDSIFSLDWP